MVLLNTNISSNLTNLEYNVTVKNTFITVYPKSPNEESFEQYSKSAPSRYSAFPEALRRNGTQGDTKNNDDDHDHDYDNNNNNNNNDNDQKNYTIDEGPNSVDEESRELHLYDESSSGENQCFFDNDSLNDDYENESKMGQLRLDNLMPISNNIKNEFALDMEMLNHETRTTLMIKNIPNKYSQKMLLSALEKHRGHFDFFYLPIDFKNKCNVGYAFINFIKPEYIPSFFREFNGQTWEKFNSQKVCSITYARIQGKNSMIEHFRNSRLLVEDKKCRPLIFNTENPSIEEEFPIGPNYPYAPRASTTKNWPQPTNQHPMTEEVLGGAYMLAQPSLRHHPHHQQQPQHHHHHHHQQQPWRRRK